MISWQARALPTANTSKTLSSSQQMDLAWPYRGIFQRLQLNFKVRRAWMRKLASQIASNQTVLFKTIERLLRVKHLRHRRLASRKLMRAVRPCAIWGTTTRRSIDMALFWQWQATCKTWIADQSICLHPVRQWTLGITRPTQRWARSHLRNQWKRSRELQARFVVKKVLSMRASSRLSILSSSALMERARSSVRLVGWLRECATTWKSSLLSCD